METTHSIPSLAVIRDQGLDPMDRITARGLGDNLTLTREQWLTLADDLRPESELYRRIVTNIALREADDYTCPGCGAPANTPCRTEYCGCS